MELLSQDAHMGSWIWAQVIVVGGLMLLVSYRSGHCGTSKYHIPTDEPGH